MLLPVMGRVRVKSCSRGIRNEERLNEMYANSGWQESHPVTLREALSPLIYPGQRLV